VILLLLLMAAPLAKLFVSGMVISFCGALISPVTDKRMHKAVSGVGAAAIMLTKSLITSVSMFVIVIAVVSLATNRGY